MENPKNNEQKPTDPKINKWALVNLASELGFIIALPLVAFGLIGKWLDNKYQHETPWLTLLGILLAIICTTVWLVRRLKEYIK